MVGRRGRRWWVGALALVLALALVPAAAVRVALANDGDIRLVVDGHAVATDVAPVLVMGRVLVPLRVAAEHLGYRVNWDARTRTVTLVQGTLTVELTVGTAAARVVRAGVGETVSLDVSARIVRGRTLVPIRFLSEVLGARVDWQAAARTVVVTTAGAGGGAAGSGGGAGSGTGGSAGGSGGSSGGGATAPVEIVVTARGLSFSPAEIRVKAGQAVTLVFRNEASGSHTLTVDGIAVTVGGAARTGIHLEAAGGASASLTFVATTPGTYEFYCAVPGHRDYGMKGQLVVEP